MAREYLNPFESMARAGWPMQARRLAYAFCAVNCDRGRLPFHEQLWAILRFADSEGQLKGLGGFLYGRHFEGLYEPEDCASFEVCRDYAYDYLEIGTEGRVGLGC